MSRQRNVRAIDESGALLAELRSSDAETIRSGLHAALDDWIELWLAPVLADDTTDGRGLPFFRVEFQG